MPVVSRPAPGTVERERQGRSIGAAELARLFHVGAHDHRVVAGFPWQPDIALCPGKKLV